MMRYFSLVFMLFLAAPSFSQVNVTATVGSASANYTTLKAAFDAINAGTHKGTVVVTLNGNTTEVSPNVINASGTGSALYDSVKITTSGNYTVSGTIAAGSPLIDLNGADNIYFEGVNSGSASLTLSNLQASATDSTCTIRMYKDARKNRINNCNIYSASTANYGGAIYIGRPWPTIGMGNDSIKITNCTIAGNASGTPNKGIYIDGTNGILTINNDGIIISNNNIVNFKMAGVYAVTSVDSLTISNNNFYHSAVQTLVNPFTPIYVSNSTNGVNFTISGNNIGGSLANCAGTAMSVTGAVQFQGIYYYGQAANPRSNINGNKITNISISSSYTTAPINNAGILIYGGRVNCGSSVGNSIGDSSSTGAIIFSYSGTVGCTFNGITTNGAFTTYGNMDTVDISNNIVAGVQVSNSSTGAVALNGIYLAGTYASPYYTINSNLIGSNTISNSISSSSNSQLSGIRINFTTSTNYYTHQITNNTISNFNMSAGTSFSARIKALDFSNGLNNFYVSNNTIKNITSSITGITQTGASAAIIGINFIPQGGLSQTLIGNKVYNLFTTATSANISITGISINTNASLVSTIVSKNKVYSLVPSTTTTPTIIGLNILGGTSIYSNNEINLGLDNTNNSLTNPYIIYGINETGGTNSLYFNTVAIQGTGVNNTSSTCALRSSNTGTRDFRNNVFANLRSFTSAGTTYNFADSIAGTISGGSITGLTHNYNLYYAPNTGGMPIINNGTTYSTLTAWTVVATNHDANSALGNPNFYSSSVLKPVNPTATFNGAAITGITTDIEGNPRTNNRVGSYENLYSLSVNIINFAGSWKELNPNLLLTTTNEKNIALYSIERSEDGNTFSKVGELRPSGYNAAFENNYHFEDNLSTVSATKLYYRIKVTELNSSSYFSKTIQLTKNSVANSVSIAPNPFSNSVLITNGSFVSITDLAGRNCTELVQANSELNILNTELLPKGYYIIKAVTNQGDLMSELIMKQ